MKRLITFFIGLSLVLLSAAGCQKESSPVSIANPSAMGVQSSGNCTLTPGYWKNHSKYATNSSQMRPWPISEDTLLCGMRWYDILWTPPEGEAWFILAHHWIAA